MKRPPTLFLILLSTNYLFGQKNSLEFKNQILTSEFRDKADIKNDFINCDIASLLTQTRNSIVVGLIGDNCQRIRIKLISVIKNNENPSQYFVYGKSMVKDNVCEFQGTITITNAFYFKGTDAPGTKQGKLIGDYRFNENPSQKHVGQFKGTFSSNWYIDKQGSLKYDDLSDEADGFSNNEFVGTWTNYSGTITKICNWGDSRIPMSGDLDDGTGEFHPSKKYQENGWMTYIQAYNGGYDKVIEESARRVEQMEWWK